MEERMIRVGVTQGDINGIGYELILKTFADARMVELCTPVVYGSAKIAAYYRKTLELPQVNFNIIQAAEEAGDNRVNIINCVADETKVELGQPTPIAGEAAAAALSRVSRDLKNKTIDVLLTAPVNRQTLQNKSFPYPGEQEFLVETFGIPRNTPLTILINNRLRIALATGDIPFADVSSQISEELLVDRLFAFERSLKQDFCVIKPRIAVLSLNPTGTSGRLGDEEERIIRPAMAEADKKGLLSFGPYAADDFFGSGLFDRFDGILAMYYDQGAAPFQALSIEDGVRYTAGLSIIHTAPVHGTAYDIAGKNIASEASFRQALYAGLDIYRNRCDYAAATANPLRKQYFDRSGDNEKLDLTKDEG